MGWLAVTEEQKICLDALNASSPAVQVNVARSVSGAWLTNDAVLPDAVPSGYLMHFAEWYSGLSTTDDVPAPSQRPPRKPR